MKIVCISDIHENLINIPECDLLLIAGDLTYAFAGDHISQRRFLATQFHNWAQNVPAKEIVVVAGNHDETIQEKGWPDYVTSVHYLEDQGIELFGLKIWGTPWQLWFYDWAYNAPEMEGEKFLEEKFSLIPDDTDIIISHGPPFGFGDGGNSLGQPNLGSHAMLNAIKRVKPKLMVCGHIHHGTGVYKMNDQDTTIINAAMVDNKYEIKIDPIVFEL